MMLDEEIIKIIKKYELPYRSISGTEAALLYQTYNETFEGKEKDIGCGECREAILEKLYNYYIKKNV